MIKKVLTGAEEESHDDANDADVPDAQEDEKDVVNNTAKEQVADDGAKLVSDGKGGIIPVDETINDPFANLNLEALKTPVVAKTSPKNIKTIKEKK